MKKNLLKTGIIGTVLIALCCFTPILVILISAVGFSAIAGYLDYVLFPALGFFVLLTAYAISRKNSSCCDDNDKSLEK